MVTTTTFPLIHTFSDLRVLESPSEPSDPGMPFAITAAGEGALRECGWSQIGIDQIKSVFKLRQEEIIEYVENLRRPCMWKDADTGSRFCVFSKKDIMLISITVPLGQGTFKTPYSYVDLITGKILAGYNFQRVFGPLKSKQEYEPYREIEILESQRGMKNLLSLDRTLTCRLSGGKGMIDTIVLTDLYKEGTLSEAMSSSVLDGRRCTAALQMIRGLMNIHAQGAIHGDLKPANIFLDIDVEGKLNLVIGDYGSYAH